MLDNKIQIISYKHNGVLHRVWQYAYIVRQTSDIIVLVNDRTNVIDGDGRRWKTKEPAVCYFFKNYWFNIICMLRNNTIYYYCNLSSPYVKDAEGLKYIDYDLDVKVFAGGAFKVVDKNEYNYHKNKFKYPKEIDYIIKKELNELINEIRIKKNFFNNEDIERWVKYYLYLENQKKY